jgi:hypothetical protein
MQFTQAPIDLKAHRHKFCAYVVGLSQMKQTERTIVLRWTTAIDRPEVLAQTADALFFALGGSCTA